MSSRNISEAQVSSVFRTTPSNPLPNIKNKLGLLEEFRFILGTVSLESIGINPSLLSRAVLNNKIEQFYDESFKQILKGRSIAAIDPGKALSQIFNKAPSANQIQFWQSVCNFLYTAAKFAEYREVGLFILFLKAGNTSRAFQLYVCLRQYFKLITLIDPTKEKDITSTFTSSENIIRVVDKAFSSDSAEYDQILDHLNNVFDCQKQIGYLEFLESAILVDSPKSLEFMVSDLLNFYHSVSEKEPAKSREQSPGFTRKPFVLKNFDLEPPKNAFSKRSKSPIAYIIRVKTKDKEKCQTKPASSTNTIDIKKPKKVSKKQVASERVKPQPKSDRIQALFHTIDRTYNNKYRGGGIDAAKEAAKKSQQEIEENEEAERIVQEENSDDLSDDEDNLNGEEWDVLTEIRPKILPKNKAVRESDVFLSHNNDPIDVHDAADELADNNQLKEESVDYQVNRDDPSIYSSLKPDLLNSHLSERKTHGKVTNGYSNMSSGHRITNGEMEKRGTAFNDHSKRERQSFEGLNDISLNLGGRDTLPSDSQLFRPIGRDGSKRRRYALEQLSYKTQSQTKLNCEPQQRLRPGGRSMGLLRLVDDYPKFEVPQSIQVESERILDNEILVNEGWKDFLQKPESQPTAILQQSNNRAIQETDNFNFPLLAVDLQESDLALPDLQTPVIRESVKPMRAHSLYEDKEADALFDISHSNNTSVLKHNDESDPNVVFNYSNTIDRRITPNKSRNEIPDKSYNLSRISPIANINAPRDEPGLESQSESKSYLQRRSVQNEFEELINYSMDVDQLALSFEHTDNSYQIFDPALKSHDISFSGLEDRVNTNN